MGPVKLDFKTLDAVVVTVSDRCATGERIDETGPMIVELLGKSGFAPSRPRVVPDGAASVNGAIAAALSDGARLVVTTGGTGISARDQTPEGTRPLLRIELHGVAESLRASGSGSTPHSMLSRGLAGIADSAGNAGALVVNLPGSPDGARTGTEIVQSIVMHVLAQLDGVDH